MLTVGSLLDDCGLELAAASRARRQPGPLGPHLRARGPDPVAVGRRAAADHRLQPRHRRRSSGASSSCSPANGLAGLGLRHRLRPQADAEGDRRRGREARPAAVRGPLRDAVHRDHRARRGAAGQRAVSACSSAAPQVHERLERLVIEGRGPGRDPRLDRRGDRRRRDASSTAAGASSRAAPTAPRPIDAAVAALAAEIAAQDAGRAAGAVRARARASSPSARSRSRCPAAAAAPRSPGWRSSPSRDPLGDFERLCARQAAIVVGLELMRERIVRETERRLAGDLLADALGERLEAEELRGRLRPFGIGGEAAVLVFELDDPPAAEATLESALADAGVPGAGRDQRRRRAAAAVRGRRHRRRRPGRHRAPRSRGAHRRARAQRRPRRRQPPGRGRLAAPRLPRGALRARGDLARRRRGARRRLAPRPRRLHAAARASGRRRAAALQRRPAGADRAHRGRVRRRAAALAGGVHRATTATGSARRASSTATATRSATGSARSRS